MPERPILREEALPEPLAGTAGEADNTADEATFAAPGGFASPGAPVPTAPAAPIAPAAPPVPAPAAPRPERPVRRVGTLTMGLALILAGAAICVFQFWHNEELLLLFCRLSPLLLVALGAEVLVSSAMAKGARLKYDFLSMFVCFFLLVGTLAASCIPLALEYAGPGRSSAEMRVEQSVYDALYERLKNEGNISQIHVSTSLTYNGSYDAVQTAADLTAGDCVWMTVELRGEYADTAAFVKACRPALDALRAQELPGLSLSFCTADPPDSRAVQYRMELSGRYQLEMSDAELLQYVSEQIYVEDAGYYMTSEEAAAWREERREEELYRQEELDGLERRLAEAEERAQTAELEAANAQQASADAEARAEALQQELDGLYQQLDGALREDG